MTEAETKTALARQQLAAFPRTVNELLNHKQWDGYITDRLGSDLFLSDPDRADRLHEAAGEGCDGSTHAETISDWRDFAKQLHDDLRRRLEDDDSDALEKYLEQLNEDIDRCEKWHEDNGSLDQQGG